MAATNQPLFTPFGGSSDNSKFYSQDTSNILEGLGKEDRPIKAPRSSGLLLISGLVVTLAIVATVTIYTSIRYDRIYNINAISKRQDLINSGLTPEQAEDKREEQKTKLDDAISNSFAQAGWFFLVALVIGLILYSFMLHSWRYADKKDLFRSDVIAKDIAYAMSQGNAIDNVSKLISYHVHPEQTEDRKKLEGVLGTNLRGSLANEMIGRRYRGQQIV